VAEDGADPTCSQKKETQSCSAEIDDGDGDRLQAVDRDRQAHGERIIFELREERRSPTAPPSGRPEEIQARRAQRRAAPGGSPGQDVIESAKPAEAAELLRDVEASLPRS